MEYDFKTLAEKYQTLPEDLHQVMSSPETIEIIRDIAADYGLLIDQTGALMDVTSFVIFGLIPSKNFVAELSKRAEIDTEKATQIAKDINTSLFYEIRSSLRKVEDEAERREAAELKRVDELPLQKADILNSIENPTEAHAGLPINMMITPSTSISVPVVTPVVVAATSATSTATSPSPIIDRLLSTPVVSTNETVERQAVPAPVKLPTVATTPPAGPDPYREPIE